MNIEQMIAADQTLVSSFNGSYSLFWDGFMWMVSSFCTWIPVAIFLLYVLIKNNKLQEGLLTICSLLLLLVVASHTAIGLDQYVQNDTSCTEVSFNESLWFLLARCREGETFSYVNSTSVFALAMFLSLIIRHVSLGLMGFAWAFVSTFSTIYLDIQNPLSVFCGIPVGCILGILFYGLYRVVQKKYWGESYCISNQYTTSGYLISDVQGLITLFLLTIFSIIVLAFYVVHCYHL